MILNAILYIIFGVVYLVSSPLRLLPDISLPANVSGAITDLGVYLSTANQTIPLTTLAQVIGAVLTVELAIFSYKGIMWIVKRIPTQS